MILKCETCPPHPFQDEKYGEKMRVHNPGKSKQKDRTRWICTVCRSEKEK